VASTRATLLKREKKRANKLDRKDSRREADNHAAEISAGKRIDRVNVSDGRAKFLAGNPACEVKFNRARASLPRDFARGRFTGSRLENCANETRNTLIPAGGWREGDRGRGE